MVSAFSDQVGDVLDIASMEPCLFRHGKVLDGSAGDVLVRLQWSHVFSDMVSQRSRATHSGDRNASMEPCLFRHGKDRHVGSHARGTEASMEPCLFRHGKNLLERRMILEG